MLNLFSSIGPLLSLLGYLPKAMDALGFLHDAIDAVESTTMTGDAKLASVLNSFETFLAKDFPDFEKPFESIAADVEAIIGDIVAFKNVFTKALAPAAT